MKIIIYDDNKAMAAYIENSLEKMNVPNLELDVFYSGESLVEYLKKNDKADIYFLDIEMDGLNGIDVGKIIRKDDKNSVIIYMTLHKDYVFDVFEVLSFRFLVKPFVEEEVLKVIGDALNHVLDNTKYYFFQVERSKYQIPYDEIIYFEGRGRKVCLHTKDEEYEFYSKISNVYDELDENIFLRVHNSYIVNMDYIRSIEKLEVILLNGISIPVSRSYR